MSKEELTEFEAELAKREYKLINSCKVESLDDWEYYKAFYDTDEELRYQIFFCFWDWTQYHRPDIPKANSYSVSVIILPESVKNDVGRRDLHLSTDWCSNIDKVEKTAEKFYEMINVIDNL